MNEEQKVAYVAYTNSDLTEGKGHDVPIAVCEIEATARRLARKQYVQGTDGPVRRCTLYSHNGYWYAPTAVVKPTEEDKRAQASIDVKAAAEAKAKAAGLSDEEIAALRR